MRLRTLAALPLIVAALFGGPVPAIVSDMAADQPAAEQAHVDHHAGRTWGLIHF